MTTETHTTTPAPGAQRPVAHSAKLLGRRGFLKGTSLALPAVMTLTPGAAQALVSVTCGEKALKNNLTAPFLTTTNTDGYYRLAVNLYDKWVKKNPAGAVCPASALGPPVNESVCELSGTAAYFAGMENGQDVLRDVSTGMVVGSLDDPPADFGEQLAGASGYAIVHINAKDGAIVAVGSPANPENAIITSAAGLCMVSLQAGTAG